MLRCTAIARTWRNYDYMKHQISIFGTQNLSNTRSNSTFLICRSSCYDINCTCKGKCCQCSLHVHSSDTTISTRNETVWEFFIKLFASDFMEIQISISQVVVCAQRDTMAQVSVGYIFTWNLMVILNPQRSNNCVQYPIICLTTFPLFLGHFILHWLRFNADLYYK